MRLSRQCIASSDTTRGVSGMWVELLQYLLAVATWEERSDTANWEKIVVIPQMTFRDSRLPTEC